VSDRELLELAAKAAGFRIRGWIGEKFYVINGPNPAEHYDPFPWNPLEDGGQALRLAVKMHFEIDIGIMSTEISGILDSQKGIAVELHQGDSCAATRRAIVRAAAEIARTQAQ